MNSSHVNPPKYWLSDQRRVCERERYGTITYGKHLISWSAWINRSCLILIAHFCTVCVFVTCLLMSITIRESLDKHFCSKKKREHFRASVGTSWSWGTICSGGSWTWNLIWELVEALFLERGECQCQGVWSEFWPGKNANFSGKIIGAYANWVIEKQITLSFSLKYFLKKGKDIYSLAILSQ